MGHVRRIAVVVASLVGSLLFMSPGVAADRSGLVLDRPVKVTPTVVRLAGLAPTTSRAVVLQRRVDGRWENVARLRVVGRGYWTNVRAATSPQRFRTVAGRLRSQVRTVPALRAQVAPTPAPDPLDPTPAGPTPAAPTPADPAAEPLPADACGAALLAADGTRRPCTFADDFDGTQLDRTKWLPQTNFITGDLSGAYACYRDHPDNVAVADGALQLTLRKESTPVPCGHQATAPSVFTAGGVSTYHLFSQRYGRFEARVKTTASAAPGLQEAFWLWPDDRQAIPVLWPEAGEIDIAETYSQYPRLAIPFLHYTADDNGGPVPDLNTAWDCAAARGVWNTYALEWTPSRLQISVNGRTCLVNTSGDAAFQRQYIVALTQGLGLSTNAPVAATPLPARMSVDYVRVWQ
jgi:beta-glucanase (GH16 family)